MTDPSVQMLSGLTLAFLLRRMPYQRVYPLLFVSPTTHMLYCPPHFFSDPGFSFIQNFTPVEKWIVFSASWYCRVALFTNKPTILYHLWSSHHSLLQQPIPASQKPRHHSDSSYPSSHSAPHYDLPWTCLGLCMRTSLTTVISSRRHPVFPSCTHGSFFHSLRASWAYPCHQGAADLKDCEVLITKDFVSYQCFFNALPLVGSQ